MSAPSKEALEAAKEWEGEDCPMLAAITDRHFAPLRQRTEQAETRVKELEAQIERITAYHAKAALKIGVLRTDNAELAGALRDARASFLGLQPDFGGPVAAQMGKAIERIGSALAHHAAVEPHKPMMRDDPRYKGTSYAAPAKHPDTDWLSGLDYATQILIRALAKAGNEYKDSTFDDEWLCVSLAPPRRGDFQLGDLRRLVRSIAAIESARKQEAAR